MGYIIKNTSGLINTRLTDTGRLKLSQGNFNISYFQIGDSEVSYNTLPSNYNQFDTFVLEPSFNAQNSAGSPNSNKENVKYPYYVDGITGNTYGIPFMDSIISPVYNRAVMRGFFTGDTSEEKIGWSALTNNLYAVNSNYIIKMNLLTGSNQIDLIYNECNSDSVRGPMVGDLITIYYDGSGLENCDCSNLPTPTPTVTPSVTTTNLFVTQTPTPTSTNTNPCASPTPTPTPSATFCPTPTPSRACPPPPPPNCVIDFRSCYPILTYRIVDICFNTITLDRPTPDFSFLSGPCYARTIIYPPSMVPFYDSHTPRPHWNDNVINFESVCYTDEYDVKIWNMNIPWSENPAGLDPLINKDYTQFGSIQYLGTKEYLGYASSSGQTDTDSVYYFNSFGDKIIVTPEEQKAIAIIHYTNQTVDFFYGEKFALEPFENVDDTTGQARNFRIHIPWLMWHKNPECCYGQTFWVDPPGFDDLDLFQVHYIESKKNVDMNNPGIRYYHLWDNNPNINGIPNRVGKVFPDAKIIIIDDEELIAAMSYKSNRNWTLPAPRLSLITPNTCGTDSKSLVGILTGESESLYVTYRLTNTDIFTNSLHNNYYSVIQGPNICLPLSSQNVAVRFGGEFNCLNQPFNPTTTTTTFNPTTTTTTTEPICGNCYQIVVASESVDILYTNCDDEQIILPVTYLNSPQFVCSKDQPTGGGIFPFSVFELGECTPSTDCTPCWMTGFTFSRNVNEFGDPNAKLNLVFTKTGTNLNGYPIFANEYLQSNIYYNGTNWVFNTLSGLPLVGIMFSGNSPLNEFNFFYQGSSLIGEIVCTPPDNLCMEIFSGGNYTYINFASITTTGGTYYVSNSDDTILYTGGTWTFYDSFFNEIAQLPDVGEDKLPIGSWVFPSISDNITTTQSNCELDCYCLGLTGDSDTDIILHRTCDGVNVETKLSSGQTIDLCVSSFNVKLGSPITGICETICEPFIQNYNVLTLDPIDPVDPVDPNPINPLNPIDPVDPNPINPLDPIVITTTTFNPIVTTTTTICPPYCDVISGFYANKFEIIVQKVKTGERPVSSEWKIIDFTDQLTNTMINGYITQEGLTGNTFVITQEEYDNSPFYNLEDYIPLTNIGYTGSQLNFGDEYYFYGSLETDIQATIYEMRYKINLGQSEFLTSSNPSWTNGDSSYVTEIGLYDNEKNLMIISKMQSPVLRQGIQQFLIKFDI